LASTTRRFSPHIETASAGEFEFARVLIVENGSWSRWVGRLVGELLAGDSASRERSPPRSEIVLSRFQRMAKARASRFTSLDPRRKP
jgi:hypothetical protein